MAQGRRQTERITRKQAGSERQAANDQERESTVQVKNTGRQTRENKTSQ